MLSRLKLVHFSSNDDIYKSLLGIGGVKIVDDILETVVHDS